MRIIIIVVLFVSCFANRHSRSPHRRDNSEDRIDKKRLLEIARRNAITMLKNGTLPGVQNLAPEAREKALEKMRIGGKTVDELTEFCKKLSKGEENGFLSHLSGDSDIDADLEKPFHHPFVIKDRGPIVMNIKVKCVQLHKTVTIFTIFISLPLSFLLLVYLECDSNPTENRRAIKSDFITIPRIIRYTSSS